MKNLTHKTFNKSLLVLSILATLPLMAATTTNKVINVTTFADENGENSAACSLREALVAAEQNQAYGGCDAGDTTASVTDNIQLKAGTYTLNSPLKPKSTLRIIGDAATNWDNKNPLTNDYPQALPIATTIIGNGQFSLIDTTSGQKPTVSLQNVRLSNGQATDSNGRGGAIISGGALNLTHVIIEKSSAAQSGGAIYLSGANSNLTLDSTIIQGNNAPDGAAIGMSCIDGLTMTPRSISIQNSSIVNNGSNTTKSILSFCGKPTIDLSANTIAQNTASSTDGSIIKFTADSAPHSSQTTRLDTSSSLNLNSNTIVENNAYASFLYDSIGIKTLSYNILAFNNGNSCRYLLGAVSDDKQTANLALFNNALARNASNTDYCYLPPSFSVPTNHVVVDVSNYTRANLLSPLQSANEQNAYLPMYFLNALVANPLIDSDDKASGSCSKNDQRGIARQIDTKRLNSTNNRCDIGSTEVLHLTAIDLAANNSSQVAMLDNFQSEADYFQTLIDDKNTPVQFLNFYANQRDMYKQNIVNYKAQLPYRGIAFDVFKQSTPNEVQNGDGSRSIRNFDANAYEVTTQALSTGADIFASGNSSTLPTSTDPNLKCQWNPTLKQIVMYRTDGIRSAAGDYDYCTYTITDKAQPNVKSSGVLQAHFNNIAPIAKDSSATFVYGTSQEVKLDLLNSSIYNDDGDGNSTQSNFPVGKMSYYVNPTNGLKAPIKFADLDSSLQITAQYSQLCPDESKQTCYGGEITIKPKNFFNKFNYPIKYQVFDADGTLSNEATLSLVNTATTSNDTRKGSSGGALGWLSVFGLLGVAAYRQRRKF